MREMGEELRRISGVPNERQKLFFASRARYTAYGGARGGGKSWALRRKLIGLCLCYPGIRCLLVRRSYAELKANHVRPLLEEYGSLLLYSEGDKLLTLPNGSSIALGYCASTRDVLRYQGQEYDIIAIDEATQLSEYQFSIFKACLRGTSVAPRRMYLTCNPGGIGHAWVKRLFVERKFREDEDPDDYLFISAQVYDNPVLLKADPDYVRQLESLPQKLRDAWLHGSWDVFEGQFFSEFDPDVHICSPEKVPDGLHYFVALDYGFDMLAAFVTQYVKLDNAYREANGMEKKVISTDAAAIDADADFPLCDVFAPAAIYHLASGLVIDENEEMSDKFFDRYINAILDIRKELPASVEKIVDRYGLT